MARPKGTAITTILNIINKPALVHWAWDLGMRGIDYREQRKHAASLGSLIHEALKIWVRNQTTNDWKTFITVRTKELAPDADPATFIQNTQAAINELTARYTITAAEVSMALERPDGVTLTGRYDARGVHNKDNGPTLISFKTSDAIYPEYWAQMAAEGMMLNVELAKNPILTSVQHYVICRIPKNDIAQPAIAEKSANDIKQYLTLFEAAYTLHNCMKAAKDMMGTELLTSEKE